MKVLHLFSNSKWTGPAEPALSLCQSLRTHGVDADFACAPGDGRSPNKIIENARAHGIEPILRFRLSKHRHPIKDALDRRALNSYLHDHPYDLIHCHLDNDHRIALRAAEAHGVPLVRSSYHGVGFPPSAGARNLIRGTRLLIEPSTMALDHDISRNGLKQDRAAVVCPAIDTKRFDPAHAPSDGRQRLGIPEDAFVAGIVARMQRHRHFHDLWEATRLLAARNPQCHVLVIGRGTHQEEVAKKPLRILGIEKRVHFAGYVQGEDYLRMLNAIDVKVFLVPGSDGTCRAVREAMAMAKPVVVADRGMLRGLVDDGRSGCVFDGSPETLCDILYAFSQDAPRVSVMGDAARRHALEHYSLDVSARKVLDLYRNVLPEHGEKKGR